MKGYESEVYEAHKGAVKAIIFIPNQGKMITCEEAGEVAIWDLGDIMIEPVRVKIPKEEEGDEGAIVTGLYT
jgi:hypothetical protein